MHSPQHIREALQDKLQKEHYQFGKTFYNSHQRKAATEMRNYKDTTTLKASPAETPRFKVSTVITSPRIAPSVLDFTNIELRQEPMNKATLKQET